MTSGLPQHDRRSLADRSFDVSRVLDILDTEPPTAPQQLDRLLLVRRLLDDLVRDVDESIDYLRNPLNHY